MTRNKMRPISPGEVLREQLEEIDMTATALATALDVPPNRITAILNEERSLTPDTALRLAKFFGSESSARFWLDLQTAYDLRKAEIDAEKTNALRSVTPLKMRKVG